MNHASLGFFFKSRSKDQNWISFGHARRAADKIGKYRAYGEMWECACEGNAVISTTTCCGSFCFIPTPLFTIGLFGDFESKTAVAMSTRSD